ncbi:hypothetical protein BC829DRAFT_403921 [Chytridium lagenaria]|nr:hypothetical protein BC829DRAFT_403921 [Chytridium lagenaria]
MTFTKQSLCSSSLSSSILTTFAVCIDMITQLKLQPCNPAFTSARDAILQSDTLLGGKYKCEISRGF